MANEIKDKLVTATTAMTITLASLADAAAKQSTMINNETTLALDVLIFVQVKTAAGAVADSTIEIYGLRADETTTPQVSTDNAGASDATITIVNAPLLGTLKVNSSGGVQTLYGEFIMARPGANWGMALKNNSGAALDAIGANHKVRYVALNPDVQ